MSNSKYAYGWVGHLLVCADDAGKPMPEGTVLVPPSVFAKLILDHNHGDLPEDIELKRLGVEDSRDYFFASGHPGTFTEGFCTYYGSVFENAEDRIEGGNTVDPKDHDAEYVRAMKANYNLDLPTCRVMVGCAGEH